LDTFLRRQAFLFTAARQLKTKFAASDDTLTGGPLGAFYATGGRSLLLTPEKTAEATTHSSWVRTS
jgi:hypothetical protein